MIERFGTAETPQKRIALLEGQLRENQQTIAELRAQLAKYEGGMTREALQDLSEVQTILDKNKERSASIDPLTGLASKAAFLSRATSMIHSFYDGRVPGACVIGIDLDHFKSINDTYGHAVGDDVLRKVGETIRHTLRPDDLVGRMGGEEINVLLLVSKEQAHARAEQLRKALMNIRIPAMGERTITASFGIAEVAPEPHPLHEEQIEAVRDASLKKADEAMYAAKEGGRNRVVVYGSPASNSVDIEKAA